MPPEKETTQESTTPAPPVNTAAHTTAVPGVFGQAPQAQPTQPAPQPEPAQASSNELPEWAQKELEKARSEAADRRIKLRETEAKLKELEPLAEKARQAEEAQKTEAEKLREQLEAARAEQQKAQAEAEIKDKRLVLLKLATKAGVSPDVVELLDLSKLDLDNEDATLATLKLFSQNKVTGGGASNPAGTQNTGPTDNELRFQYFGAGRSNRGLIFGGNK
ncbi:hypothetical protein KC887_01230 [Candidatus Kaiserbacteria bacterium]|nr:hypothetical protein [Candidatus Kaiserbacteria bacterium]